MKTITKSLRLFILFITLLFGKSIYSQTCTASFNVLVGANGLVTFTSTSAPVNTISTTYYWTFGNGLPTTTVFSSPFTSYTYSLNGTYTVTLFYTTTTPSCSAQTSAVITITNAIGCPLVANFSATNLGNGIYNFSNNSVGTSTVTSYNWNFGNGNTSTLSSPPATTYTASGNYQVSLTASNGGTCASTYTANVFVCLPILSFTSSTGPNGQLFLTNTSPNTNSLSIINWTVQSNSYLQFSGNTQGTYSLSLPANGNYVVGMYVNINGCAGVVSQTININNVICGLTASFTSISGGGNIMNFINQSIGTNVASTYQWNFGDGGNSTLQAPQHTYSTSGIYVASLLVSNGGTCVSTSTAYVNVPICPFNASFTSSTGANGLLLLTSTTPNTNSLSVIGWTVSAGSYFQSSTSSSTTYSLQLPSNGIYTVGLYVSNGTCVSLVSGTVSISNITGPCSLSANFSYAASQGTVSFMNTSVGTNSTNTNYAWNFGNGQIMSGPNVMFPMITYTSNGTYSVSLIVTTSSPACTSSISMPVLIDSICNLSASFVHTVFPNGNVSLVSTSLGTNSNTIYYWNYGDGSSGTGPVNSHLYNSAGNYIVSLLVSDGGTLCVNSASQSINITGINCIANSNFSLLPTNVPQVWTAIPAFPWNVTNAIWNWGDGSSSNFLYTSHSYSAAGLYDISLTVTVSCGSSSSTSATYSISKVNSNNQIIQINVEAPTIVPVGIENIGFEPIQFNLYPNPNAGDFTLQLNNRAEGELTLAIFNLMGVEIYKNEIKATEALSEIHLNEVANGIYFVKVSQGKQTYIQKFVISK